MCTSTRSLTHHSQFSRQCPTLVHVYVMFVWSGLMSGFLSIFFLKIPVWLVCYAHGFHVHMYMCIYVCVVSLVWVGEVGFLSVFF